MNDQPKKPRRPRPSPARDHTRSGRRSARTDRPAPPRGARQGWDSVAAWYDGWVGADGSEHHRRLAIPGVMALLSAQAGEQVLDVGCGQGVLAPHVAAAGARYTGVDVSPRLLGIARKHHGAHGQFIKGDACKLYKVKELGEGQFDAVTFLLSIQDIDPLDAAIRSAGWALRHGGRLVMLMTHPCFRIPRQSGWGYDEGRRLQYRRIDRYLTPLPIPMKTYPGKSGVTISFHRPLSHYVNALGAEGLLIDRMDEIRSYKDNPAEQEIPLFLGIRARKLG